MELLIGTDGAGVYKHEGWGVALAGKSSNCSREWVLM
jgi:hypothetical protein